MRVARTFLIALCLPALLASCDGGDSSSESPPLQPADTSPPVITLSGDDPQIIVTGTPYSESGATATDNVDGDLSASITIDASEVDTRVPGTYSVTYDVVDTAGNAAVTAVRTVVLKDNAPPAIILLGYNPLVLTANDSYTEYGAIATDDFDGNLSGSMVIDARAVDTSVAGEYSVTYNVSDSAGNAADTVTRIVKVLASAPADAPPVITLIGDNPLVLTTNDSYTEHGAIAADDIDGDLSSFIAIDARAVDTSVVGEYSVTYNVSDSAGNAADTATRIVEVLAKTPDFAHMDTPHVMSKNPFALPSQTDQFQLLEPRFGKAPLMVILLEFPDSPHNPGHTVAYFDDLIFGDDPSVNGYFAEVSYGLFSFQNAGITDWLIAPLPASYYFDRAQADNYQYTTLAAVAVQATVDAGVDLDAYDQNDDGKVTRDELQILVVLADHPSLGKPNLMATRFDQHVAQGVVTPAGTEIDTWAMRVEENTGHDDRRVYITFYAHELAHMALALPDLYNDDFGEDPAGPFSIMSDVWKTYSAHISPWAKIHLGWISPTVIAGCGQHEIKAVESTPEAYVLYTPSHGVNEYFIIENRWPMASVYMSHADEIADLDRGLAMWHITEFYDDEPFDFLKGRKMIGMKWAGGATSMDFPPYHALWDCSLTFSCYDFTSDSIPRNSRWQSGTPSGIEIVNISNAGKIMTVTINRTDGCGEQ
jgi:M6 family metalloprotease-like protein